MASCTTGKRGLKPAKSDMGGRPPEEPRSASSRRQTASAASAAMPIWRTAVSRGTSRPTRTTVTMTPMDPRNHSAVISQSRPEGGGVMSSVTWISTEVLACTRGTQITTSTTATPTRTASEARRRVVPPPWGPRRSERTRWLQLVCPTSSGRDVSSLAAGAGEPMIFMSEGWVPVLCSPTGPRDDARPQSWPLRPLLAGREPKSCKYD